MASVMRQVRSALREIDLTGRSALALFVPPVCVACETRLGPTGRWLCRRCRCEVRASVKPRSRTLQVAGGKVLEVRYSLDYTPKVARIITEMKYADKPGIARLLAAYLAAALEDSARLDAVLVPVPMHRSKKRERGFNQSEVLAAALARNKGLAVRSDLLQKKRDTPSQTTLEREARLENVADAFRLRPGSRLHTSEVILIDDVITTGSTLRECAAALGDLGPMEISACVVASSLR